MDYLTAAQATTGLLTGPAATAQAATNQAAAPDFTIVFILASLLVAIALPLTLLLVGKLRDKGSLLQTLKGMFGFVLFQIILTALISHIIIPSYYDQDATTMNAVIQLVIMTICMEVGRFGALWIGRKKRTEFGNAVTLATGYCIFEALIIICILVPYLLVAVEGGSVENNLFRELRLFVTSDNLIKGQEWRFLIKGFVCIVFCMMQLCSSIFVFFAIQKKNYWFLILPVLFDLLILIPNRMASFENAWYWDNPAVTLPYLGIVTVIYVLLMVNFKKKEYPVVRTDTLSMEEEEQ